MTGSSSPADTIRLVDGEGLLLSRLAFIGAKIGRSVKKRNGLSAVGNWPILGLKGLFGCLE